MTDVMTALASQMADRIADDLDGRMQELLLRRFDVHITKANVHEFTSRGQRHIYPDGIEVLFWDGVPVLKLWPATTEIINGKLTYRQNYQEL